MKRGRFLLVVLLLSSILFLSQINAAEEDNALGGYACLESIVDQRGCDSFSTEERAFLVMAADYCRDEVVAGMNSENSCWPSNSCTVKDTAQAVFALYEKREDVESAKDWLLTQTIPAQGLDWFLEVETASPTSCIVRYNGGTYDFVLDRERRISGDVGNCLAITPEGYWFQINPSCFEQEFDVICGESFLTTLLFQETGSNTINVLSDYKEASASGTTTQRVSARCFTQGGGCNYEASLWATFALWAIGEEVSDFVPYLTAMKNDNPIYLPEAFLYFLTGKFQIELLDKQRSFSYWSESGNSYYDTALALWPMRYEESNEKQNAKDWLISTQIRAGDNQGCWNGGNIRDTAFILRSVWYEFSPSYSEPGTGCQVNTDCPIGELCGADGVCYDPNEEECETNEDCNVEGEICDNGYCIDPDNPPVCNDGVREGSEECDGYEYGGQTCETMGLGSGTLHCNSDCTIDSNDCGVSPICEYNFQCDTGEKCENGQCVEDSDPDPNPWPDPDPNPNPNPWPNPNPNPNPNPDPECSFDFQCDPGEICENNECVSEPDPPIENVTCTFDWQCDDLYGEGWICENENCIELIESNFTSCSFDFQCENGEICEDSECISINASSCIDDGDCPGADICVGGICQEREEDCVFDWQCEDEYGSNGICEAGYCINESETTQCISYWDCDVGEECINGVCLEEGIECEYDYQCLFGEECVAGTCVSSGGGNETCEFDFDCSDWTQICVNGLCVDEEFYDCEDEGYACMFDSQCSGQIMPLYTQSCNSPFICCDTLLPLESCFEKNGVICLNGEICVAGVGVNSSELELGETCCLSGYCLQSGGEPCDSDLSCEIGQECIDGFCVTTEETYDCEIEGGYCRPFGCEEGEQSSIVYSCEYADDSCCIPQKEEEGRSGIWLIIILLILIALVVAGILFRDKLKVYWLKVKSKFEKGGKSPHGRRPGMYPPGHPMHRPLKKKQSFMDKLKGFFTGKKPPKEPMNRAPPHHRRPLRGPLAIQHAQRQAEMKNKPKHMKSTPLRHSLKKPEPIKSTSTVFTKGPGIKISKKKPPKNKPELDEVLNKLKKMSKEEQKADKESETKLSSKKP